MVDLNSNIYLEYFRIVKDFLMLNLDHVHAYYFQDYNITVYVNTPKFEM